MKKLLTLLFAFLAMNISAQVDVTFQVDMTGQTIDPNGVHVAGNFNSWNTSSTMLTDQGSNIYAVTVSLAAGYDVQYKYLNGNVWGKEEAAPSTCTISGSNRIFTTPTTNKTLDVVPFNDCPSPTPTQNVTFSVDMTGQTVSGDGVHVAGNFQAWDPSATMLTNVGGNIYEVTVSVLSSITTIQYKYINGNAWGADETVPAPCANGDNNRHEDIEGAGSNIRLPTYDFGTCASVVLPVELTFFNGKVIENGIELNWQTASEEQNEGFQIEKSIDGKRWETIGLVEGNGTTFDVQNYTFSDRNPFANINYYRLKQLDFDGGFEYSNIVLVDFKNVNNNNSSQIFPNPVQDELNIINARGELTLYNAIGQPLKNQIIPADNFTLNTNDLQNGTYLLMINKDDGSRITKVIVK